MTSSVQAMWIKKALKEDSPENLRKLLFDICDRLDRLEARAYGVEFYLSGIEPGSASFAKPSAFYVGEDGCLYAMGNAPVSVNLDVEDGYSVWVGHHEDGSWTAKCFSESCFRTKPVHPGDVKILRMGRGERPKQSKALDDLQRLGQEFDRE